jgi:hypothetical protein
MTPNQARAIPDALGRLLDSGERQGLTPEREIAEVTHSMTPDDDRVYVFTFWTDQEREAVTLSVTIDPDGTVLPRDAEWPVSHGALSPDPLHRPGVRIGDDGLPRYSAAWL